MKSIIQKIFKKKYFTFPFIIIVLFDLLFFSPLFIPRIRTFITPEFGGGDSITVQIPYRYVQCLKLKEFKLPFWSSQMSSGYPLLAEGEIGAFNPINIISCIAGDPQVSFNFQIILHTLLFQIGLILLARKLKIRSEGQVILSILLPFTPLFTMNYMQATLIFPFSYTPFILYFYLCFLENKKKKDYLFFILSIFFQFLSCHYQSFFVSSVVLFIFFVTYSFFNNKGKVIKSMFPLILGYVFAVCLAGFQTWPGWEFFQQSNRGTDVYGSYGSRFDQNFSLQNFLSFLYPYINGFPQRGTYPFLTIAHPWEGTLHIYVVPTLFLFGLLVRKKRTHISRLYIPVIFTLVFITLLIMGKNSPLYFIESIPPFSSFRFPTRFAFMLVFILCFISVLGFTCILDKIKSVKIRKLVFICAVTCIFMEAFGFTYGFHTLGNIAPYTSQNSVVQTGNKRIYIPYIDSMIYNDDYVKNGYGNGNKFFFDFIMASEKSNINLLKQTSGYNTEIGPQLRRFPLLSAEMFEPGGYNLDTKIATFSPLARQMLVRGGVTDIISSFNYPDAAFIKKTATNTSLKYPLYHYILAPTPERITIYNKTVLAATYGDIKDILSDPNSVDAAIIEDSSYVRPPQSRTIHTNYSYRKNTDEDIIIRAYTDSDAFLVLADSYYPGWRAYIDGNETKLTRANFVYKGVNIPKGDHLIEFKYVPFSFFYGSILSAVGVCILWIFLQFFKWDSLDF